MISNGKNNVTSEFERYYLDPRQEIVRLVPKSATKVLDVGCGGGLVGSALKGRGVTFVAGIEGNHQAARIAQEKIDRVIEGDVEAMDLPFEKGFFDCIILADILEHLRNPWALLKTIMLYLADDGIIVCSIPNVGHYRIIKNLLCHSWRYTDEGILDKTHLRFFTITTIREMFHDCNLKIIYLEFKFIANRPIRYANMLLCGAVYNIFKHYFCEQYVLAAQKM